MSKKVAKKETTSPTRGRPKEFDEEKVLNAALDAFWKYGFDNTSLSILVESTGLNKPSLYATFGSKEELFEKAIKLYTQKFSENIAPTLNHPILENAIEAFFLKSLDFATSGNKDRGCIAVHGAIASSNESDFAQKILLNVRIELENYLYKRIQKAVKENNFPTGLDPKAYAKLLACMHSGMNIQIVGHTKKEELKKVIKLILLPLNKNN